MKNITLKSYLIIIFVLISQISKAQGCSDAGFCTIDGLKPEHSTFPISLSDENKIPKNQLKIGVLTGKADHSISVFGNYIEYSHLLSKKLAVNIKLSSLSQTGNNISNFGLSDVFLSGYYQITSKMKIISGVKIPLSNADQKEDNLSLPMDYQSSLGTTDLILAIGYQLNNWQLSMGLQQPILQNSNQFSSESYPTNSPLNTFQSTNNFKRSADVLLRVSYFIPINESFQITPSILPIYHLSNDRYTNSSGKEIEIEGSKGLTLNINTYLNYNINTTNALQFSFGFPIKVRKVRPDGLTRSFVANLEYKFSF